MYKQYKYNEAIKTFKVDEGKVFTTITLGEYKITNPTLEQFLSAGWEEYTPPEIEPEPYIPTLEELVEQKIRERYTINQEFEVQRKRDVEKDNFNQYYSYVEECIEWAHTQPHRDEA